MATKIRPFNLHTDTETRIQTLAGNLIDSAYVNARVSTVDSAAVQVIVDSDYIKTTLKVGSTNTIFRYVSTANQTSFTGSDANSATLAYNPGAVQVFLNGSLLTPTVDFTTDSGDTITLVSGAALGSELVINTYKDGIITPTNALPIIGGELTGNLTMGDNKKIKLGNDSDAEIFHNASNTIINDKGTGNILLQVAGTTHFQTDANGVQIPDNKKLLLGASSDLQIYHDGSNSFVDDAGSGSLYLRGESQVIIGNMSGEQAAVFNDDGAVTLNYDNSQKLATTSGGVTVTGTTTATKVQILNGSNVNTANNDADDLIVEGPADCGISILSATTGRIYFGDAADDDIGSIRYVHSDNSMRFEANAGERMRITSSGTVGIGVVPETTWNSNIDALQLGLGASIYGDNTATGLQISANTVATLGSSLNGYKYISSDKATTYQQYDGQHNFRVAGSGSADGAITWTTALTINNSGNVGIGTSSPSSYYAKDLVISSPDEGGITIVQGTGHRGYLAFADGTSGSAQYRGYVSYDHNDDMLYLGTDGGGKLFIDTSGRVGIGASNMGDYQANNDDLLIATSGSTGITIRSGTTDQGRIAFADGTGDLAEEMRGLIMYNHNGNAMSFFTGSTQRMIINSSGDAGIGTSSPNSRLEVRNDTNASTPLMVSSQLQTAGNYHDFALGVETYYAVGLRRTVTQSTPSYLRPRLDFFVQHYNTYQAADRSIKMSIKDTGKVGIATTTPDEGSMMTIVHPGSSVYGMRLETSQTSGTQYHLTIYRNTTHAGYITSNANNQVALNSVSDERLKKNIVNSSTATQSIKDLKVRKFDWKDDSLGGVDFGFVAQEVVSVVPEAVTQGSDAVDDNSSLTQPWGIDYSHIVPRLVKTIQELEARITELENK